MIVRFFLRPLFKAIPETWHFLTENRHRRIAEAENAIPVIERLHEIQGWDYGYHITRATDYLGGLVDVRQRWNGLKRSRMISLYEIERYAFALKIALSQFWGGVMPPPEIKEEIESHFEVLEDLYFHTKSSLQQHYSIKEIESEQEWLKTQVRISWLTAIAAFSAAISSIMTAVAAFEIFS